MRVTVTPKDEERLVVLMARERPRSAVVSPGGDLVTAGGGGGEASDGDSSASLEEISADDFKKESSGGGGAGAAAAAQRSRVWMGYTMSRSYAPAFHSFAWAQAVQKKPLVPHTAADEDEVEHVVDTSDEEKEEGEIEEGEAVQTSSSPPRAQPETIDLDSDAPEKSESVAVEGSSNTPSAAAEEEEVDFDQRVGSILEELEMVSTEEAEKSFEGACARLHTCFESLKPLFPESGSPMPMLDALVQQAFVGIDTITTVANSYSMLKREQNKNTLLKLLFHIKNRYSGMLTPDQRDELDSRVRQLVFEDGKDNANGPNANCGTSAMNVVATSGQIPSKRLPFESGAASPFSSSSLPKLEIPAKNRMVSPLLDLHADYDENSLPSPTRDNAPTFPVPKPIGFGAFPMAPDKPSFPEGVEHAKYSSYPSLTDPLKAVSSYQQKYGQKSAFPSDDLPSPTPSGDGDKSGGTGGDIFGEISSFSSSNKTALPSVSQIPASQTSTASSSSDSFTGGPPGYAKQIEQSVSGPNHALKPIAKSRDPRLRFLNRDPGGAADANRRVNFVEPNASKNGTLGGGVSINNRKHKAVDEPLVDENMLKRARGSIGNLRDMQILPGRGLWAENGSNISSYPIDRVQSNQNTRLETKTTGNPNLITDSQLTSNVSSITNSSGTSTRTLQGPQSNSAPQTSASTTVSLPAVLKDIAVNPTVIMHWIQMEQQKRSASEPQQKVNASSGMASGMIGNVTAGMVIPPGNAPKTAEVGQIPSVRPQVPMQTAPVNSQNDAGVIRMKPRDPRRILHNNIAQKNDTAGSEQTKSNGTAVPESQGSKDNLTNREQQAEQLQSNVLSSQPASLSNIARPFAMSANAVYPVSNSQLAATALMPPQQHSGNINRADLSADAATNTAPATALDAVPPANSWGDVDHLLGGYDDQQKALIQKERARRIMEQHKMFAARKLCLVLDLDHTLLNSAKSIEVDPIHEEVLQKKKEQDRERAERHLFRFHHMGMWTKLRPGIWNFLEKASKLFELHLYTMGNKLYATEMAKVLDPTGVLCAGRVVSRGDDGDPFLTVMSEYQKVKILMGYWGWNLQWRSLMTP